MGDNRLQVMLQLEKFTASLVKKLTLNVTACLQDATPVDTGWARSNWVPQIGSPFRGTAGTKEDADNGNIDASTTQKGLSSVVGSYQITMGPVYISNNVPYIKFLNEGSSQQAPAAFVQASVIRGIKQTK